MSIIIQISKSPKNLRFLDIALDSSVRAVIERGFEELHKAGPEVYLHRIFISAGLPILWLTSYFLVSCGKYLHVN